MDITIIIPAYNRIWSLPKAVESCKNNGNLAVQIIVVDDGSSDGTWEMLEKIAGIEIYKQQNWGKPWAVNMAFSHAKGKYIKFLDSDDWILPNTLEKQFHLAEKENADIVVAGYVLYDLDRQVRTQQWIECDDFIAQNLGECDSSHYSAFLFRKEFIKDIPHRTSFASANFASRDDRCFMLETALNEPKIVIFDEPTLAHLSHGKERLQFQQNTAAMCTNYQHLLIYRNIIRQLVESGRLTTRRIDASIKVLWPLCHWIAKYDLKEAISVLDWIQELKGDFKPPQSGTVNRLYNMLGFKLTEQILNIRRRIKNG